MNKLIGVSQYRNVNGWEIILNSALTIGVEVVTLNNIDKLPKLDYLVFDGGADVCPYYYGENRAHRFTSVNVDRDEYEYFLFQHYIRTNTKIRAVCRGHQFVNVMLGGTLYQHLHDMNKSHKRYHDVNASSFFEKRTGLHCFTVNSTHHQAVRTVGPAVGVTLVDSEYGIIEGTDFPNNDVKTVQSHPEYLEKEYPASVKVLRYLFDNLEEE